MEISGTTWTACGSRTSIRRAALAALTLAIGCAPPPSGDGTGATRWMGMGDGPIGGSGTLPPPAVVFLGEIAPPGLVAPTRLAEAPGDALLVSDARGRGVFLLSANGAVRARLAGFTRPLAVGAGAHGELYVGDAGDGSVRIVDRTGAALGAFGVGAGELTMPNDLAVDATTGEVYVADSKRSQVRVYTAFGGRARKLLAKGTEPGRVSFPTGILVDPEGRLLVADHDNARIERFTSGGELLLPVIGGTVSPRAGGMMRPQGIARDALGRLYVADAYVGKVQVFDPNGAHLAWIGETERVDGKLALPSDVVVDRFGRLLVASYDTGRILVYGIDEWVAPPTDALARTQP